MSSINYLRMSSYSIDEGEVLHYAYPVLRIFPPFPTGISTVCHHAVTNNILLRGGQVGTSNKREAYLALNGLNGL
jgi:hypothetical protein